jgi:Na+-transporting NADH:ubiquinone oxidoreductase subunit F
VDGNLDITVPPELLVAKNWQCTVLESRTLSPLIKEIVLALPQSESQEFPAGCYVIVVAPPFELAYAEIEIGSEYEADWARMGLRSLRVGSDSEQSRAYSLVNRPGETQQLVLNIRLALPPAATPQAPPGVVSSYLFGLKPGDAVQASGHYGNFFIQKTDREIILIGGGVGLAPLYAHVYDQLERLDSNRTISFWYGARSLRDLYYADEMEALAQKYANFSWHVAVSDPEAGGMWSGACGFIHEVIFDEYLGSHPDPMNCEYYLCGPPLMIAAVRDMLKRLEVPPENILFDDFGA